MSKTETPPALPWHMLDGNNGRLRPFDCDFRGGRLDVTARFRLPLSGPDVLLSDVLVGVAPPIDVDAAVEAAAVEIGEHGHVNGWRELAGEMDGLRGRLVEAEQHVAYTRQRRDQAEPAALPDWLSDCRAAEQAAANLQDAIAFLRPRLEEAERKVQQVVQAAASECWLAQLQELQKKEKALQLALVERLQGRQSDGRDLLTEVAVVWHSLQTLRSQQTGISRRLGERLRQTTPAVAGEIAGVAGS